MITAIFRTEKRWGSFEFKIMGTNVVIGTNGETRDYVKARLALTCSFGEINITCNDFIPLENYENMVDELEKKMLCKEFCEFDLNEVRLYVIPPMHEIDINTYDGFTDLFESEYGENSTVITIAVKLDRDEGYDELYPNNEFVPNLQIALEHEDSVRFVQYLKESVPSVSEISIT